MLVSELLWLQRKVSRTAQGRHDPMYTDTAGRPCHDAPITGGHSIKDQILLVKIAIYVYQVGFCVYRRSYFMWPPVIDGWW